jgi:uncharacterized protein
MSPGNHAPEISLYDASVSVFVRMLNNLSAVLRIGEAYVTDKGIDPAEILYAQLAPDMFRLIRQVQTAGDVAQGAAARLAQLPVPEFLPHSEKSFSALIDRLAHAIAFLKALPAERFDGGAARIVSLTVRGQDVRYPGLHYLLHYVHPNFYFHCTAAYLILRHHGAPVGKLDFIGGL